MLRHLLPARDRSVFDRNKAMTRAIEAGEPVTGVYVQCFLSRLDSNFPQFGLLVSRSVGAVRVGVSNEEGIGPPNRYIPGL